MQSDGGLQFKSSYSNWLSSLGILQETSSLYHSSSNGLAEKAVQDVKNVIKRQTDRYNLDILVAEHNNIARTGMDKSPADLFFNRVVRSSVPGSGRRILDFTRAQEKRLDEQRNIQKELGRGRLSLDVFREGDRVRLQDVKTKKWNTKGTVVSEFYHDSAQTPSSYFVDSDEGGTFLRNGKFIRLLNGQNEEDQNPDT